MQEGEKRNEEKLKVPYQVIPVSYAAVLLGVRSDFAMGRTVFCFPPHAIQWLSSFCCLFKYSIYVRSFGMLTGPAMLYTLVLLSSANSTSRYIGRQ